MCIRDRCNCAQAVLKAFEDKLPVDADTLMKLCAGYAAGMGCMESTSGALIGAVMVAGIVTDGKGTPRISKERLQNFQMCIRDSGAERIWFVMDCGSEIGNAAGYNRQLSAQKQLQYMGTAQILSLIHILMRPHILARVIMLTHMAAVMAD